LRRRFSSVLPPEGAKWCQGRPDPDLQTKPDAGFLGGFFSLANPCCGNLIFHPIPP
jgi:hypothetical protein